MAVEFKVPHTRRNTYLFAPESITINPEMNGRHDLPDIEWLIESMVKYGQRTPVQVGNDGGSPVLMAGHCRWRAAIEINKRGLTPEPFKLSCVFYKSTSELDSYLATISENYDRTAPKPIDEAHQIAILERYGMSLEDMAKKVYRQDVKWVKDRLALIGLCDEAQQAVSSGDIKKISAAVALAKLSKNAQKEALKKSRDSGSTLTAASLKSESASAERKKTLEAAMTEAWGAYAEDSKESLMSRLGRIQMDFLKDRDLDAYHKSILALLRGLTKSQAA